MEKAKNSSDIFIQDRKNLREAKENEIPSPSYQELLSNTSLKSNKGTRKAAKSKKTKKMILSTDGQGKTRKTSTKTKLRLPAKTGTLSQLRM